MMMEWKYEAQGLAERAGLFFSLEKKTLKDNLIFMLYYLGDRQEGGKESRSSDVHSTMMSSNQP